MEIRSLFRYIGNYHSHFASVNGIVKKCNKNSMNATNTEKYFSTGKFLLLKLAQFEVLSIITQAPGSLFW